MSTLKILLNDQRRTIARALSKIQKLKLKRLKQINVKHEYKSFYKTSLTSLVIIFMFFVLPETINFIKKILYQVK